MGYKRNAAVLAILMVAVVLIVSPPLVATVSMVDPSALNNLARWLERMSPTISYLDYAKAALTLIAPIVLWRAEARRATTSRAGLEDRATPRARGWRASTDKRF